VCPAELLLAVPPLLLLLYNNYYTADTLLLLSPLISRRVGLQHVSGTWPERSLLWTGTVCLPTSTRRASWVSKYNVLLVLCFFNMAQHQHVPTHVATPSSSCCERLTTAPAPGGLFCVCASTEPAGTGIGAVCVEGGGQTLPKKMLNHTHIHAHHTHTHTHTEKLKTRHPTLVSEPL